MFRRMNPSVLVPLFAIELMWLFQVRFHSRLHPGILFVLPTIGFMLGLCCS